MASRLVHETPFAAVEPASALRRSGRACAGRVVRVMRRRRPDRRAAAAALAATMFAAGCVPAGEPTSGAAEGAGTESSPGQATSDARAVERWQCGDRYDGCLFRCPVTLTADRSLGVGTITIDGAIEQATVFRMDGLDRRWDWCPDADGTYDCTVTIAPNGDGLYFKFLPGESTAKPSQFYACRRVRP